MKKQQVKPDVAGLVIAVQHQIASLEKKIDLLISKSSGQPPAMQHSVKTFQPVGQGQRNMEVRQENRFRDRVLHKAICADCKKECEVPFKPSGDRPVYCKDCFSKRKSVGPFKSRPDNRPRGEVVIQASHPEKRHTHLAAKVAAKRKPALRKKKKR